MLFILRHSDHSVENQRELRRWYSDNGILYSELTDPALVDSVAQTVTVNKKVPMAGQDDLDFPEFVLDADDEPVTVAQVIHLTAVPLRWMLTMTGAWDADQGIGRQHARRLVDHHRLLVPSPPAAERTW